MSSNQTRRKDRHQGGNGGQFTTPEHAKADPVAVTPSAGVPSAMSDIEKTIQANREREKQRDIASIRRCLIRDCGGDFSDEEIIDAMNQSKADGYGLLYPYIMVLVSRNRIKKEREMMLAAGNS